jgi:hypothetical protein
MPPDWVSSHQEQSATGPSVCQSVQPKHSDRQEATVGSGSQQDGDRRQDGNVSWYEVHPVTIPAISSACSPLHLARSSGMPETDDLLLLC